MDYDVIKEIPGYKVILKAVLKNQIQQLVEQLSSSAEEESVILTASIADGTLSHLGSESGKGFLEDHEDIKSQFLGFCLKKHHRKKQEEQERQEAEALQQSLQTSPGRYGVPGNTYMIRSPRFASPRGRSPIHPVRMIRASLGRQIRPAGARHEPYPMTRPPRRTSLNVDPGRGQVSVPSESPMRAGNKLDGRVIKIEPDNDESNQSDGDTDNQDKPGTSEQSPSREANPNVKSESGGKDDDARSESSTSTIPNEPASDGLGLDSDLANLISGNAEEESADGGELDTDVGVKLEVLNEAEMELEITGVEPGRPILPQNDWDPNVSMGMNFDPTGATGNQGDMTAQGYSPSLNDALNIMLVANQAEMMTRASDGRSTMESFVASGSDNTALHGFSEHFVTRKIGVRTTLHTCNYIDCKRSFVSKRSMMRHVLTHTKEKPFACRFCTYQCARKDNLRVHEFKHASQFKNT